MSGLNLNPGDADFIRNYEKGGSYRIRTDFIDQNCILLKNVCLKGICLKNWAEATIYEDGVHHDRVKGSGFFMFNWPQFSKYTKIEVETIPETEWALIIAVEAPRDMKKGERLKFWEPLENINKPSDEVHTEG